MKLANTYPVSFKDFCSIKAAGNYIITYALLDDRIHLEMAVENAVFVTHRFYNSLIDEFKEKGDNYQGSKMKLFLDQYFNGLTTYRFYPTELDKQYLKSIKLYSRLVVKKSASTELSVGLNNYEYDDKIVTKNNKGETILEIEKVI